MKLPWHDRSGIQKAIAICAAICIVSFGLCSAGLMAANRDDRWLKLSQMLFGICGSAAILSFALALFLYAWNEVRRTRK